MKRFSALFLLFAIALTACGNAISPATAPVPATETSPSPATESAAPATAIETPAFDFTLALEPVRVTGTYQFAEGPAVGADGNVYFSDINAGKIYVWSPDGSVNVFLAGLNRPNGLAFDADGNLIACEGGSGRVISIDPQGNITVLADQYNGIRFNEPNDLWIDPLGGIYFTDPAYQSAVVQDGQHVYYLTPDRSQVVRVIADLTRPNGIAGTADGTRLYVADHGAGRTYVYDINSDGTLSGKQLFAATGSDGMTLDAAGNLYLTTQNQVQIYNASGVNLKDILTQENPTNVEFAGTTLFITARTAVYTVGMSAEDAATGTTTGAVTDTASASGFALTSPDVADGGRLPVEYTCDGVSATLALAWSGAPEGTAGYAVIMHHEAAPDDIHWYWVVYGIPAGVTGFPKNMTGIGTLGTNGVNGRTEYSPPCSKGPGDKTYTYTVYALSAQPQLSVPAAQVDRAALLEAIRDITLASAELNVIYARP